MWVYEGECMYGDAEPVDATVDVDGVRWWLRDLLIP
jgi:hypothetical protein